MTPEYEKKKAALRLLVDAVAEFVSAAKKNGNDMDEIADDIVGAVSDGSNRHIQMTVTVSE